MSLLLALEQAPPPPPPPSEVYAVWVDGSLRTKRIPWVCRCRKVTTGQ